MNKAVIDIGSNSIQLLVARVDHQQLIELVREQRVTGLGRKLDQNGFFLPEAMEETLQALHEFSVIAQKHNIAASEINCLATEASRVASNAQVFFQRVHDELALKVQIISGELEAELSALGVAKSHQFPSDLENIVIMDIGGASTELIQLSTDDLKIRALASLKMGSVRYNGWLQSKNETFAQQCLESALRQTDIKQFITPHLYCVAGTMTSVANMIQNNQTFDEDKIDNFQFQRDDFLELGQQQQSWKPADYLQSFPFLGKRAHVMAGGMAVAHFLFDHLQVQTITVSTKGLMHGFLIKGTPSF